MKLLKSFFLWAYRSLNEKSKLVVLSVLLGITTGLVAFVIKTLVHFIRNIVEKDLSAYMPNYAYLVYPFIGIGIALVFVRFVLKQPVNHGIPSVLYAISKKQGFIKSHNMFSSIVTSVFTVGFGGSVGLEGPTVATGAAYGSWMARFFRLSYKHRILLLGAASAGTMAAIFKAPIAAIVFALEVIMLDLTTTSIIPLLFASFSAYLTSYFLMGKDVLYPVTHTLHFELAYVPWIIGLGILSGAFSVYFTKMYLKIHHLFEKIASNFQRLLIGTAILGALIFLFPSLYGEGYEAINQSLNSDFEYLFENSVFYNLRNNFWVLIAILAAVVILKAVAATITFGSGGVGGIFAPTLFMGVNTGLLFALLANHLFDANLSLTSFALMGMGGMIAGVLQAPLTAMFLIADLTSGYQMLVPLMITATISYVTAKQFVEHNVYTYQLAERGELLTHHADKNILTMMNMRKLIETNFVVLHPEQTLRELVEAIKVTSRNVFPVVDENNRFLGIVTLDELRQIMFDTTKYDTVLVRELMFVPTTTVDINDTMEDVAHKIQSVGRFNVAVVQDGKYLGFVSRANVFSAYRDLLKKFSEH